ncbi:hypothetical protein [Natranaeroarchaeum aerophilus]|nr:hypothetical protein [Natranaeroarchaeum aerophilus]MCL9812678.1 hypothetical protein [Natranaeroarchaeum aerophilus]
MMPDCPRCGTRMSMDDETTKLVEYRCTVCHTREVEHRTGSQSLRQGSPDVA